MRIPRKIKKKIPSGLYCYSFVEFLPDGIGFRIKSCPFYEHDEWVLGHCTLLNCEVEDQCKSCNCKIGKIKIYGNLKRRKH